VGTADAGVFKKRTTAYMMQAIARTKAMALVDLRVFHVASEIHKKIRAAAKRLRAYFHCMGIGKKIANKRKRTASETMAMVQRAILGFFILQNKNCAIFG
jgi:hypothetical protein